jgi:glucose/arabinose dehydrogenase
MIRPATAFAALCAAALGPACGEDAVGPPPGSDTSLVIVPRSALLVPGDTLRLRAAVTAPAGDTLTADVTWSSRDAGVASVDTAGLLTGVALGATWVRAEAMARQDSVFVTVAASVALPALQLLTSQLSSPVFLTQPPGETDRLFVVEQGGRIRILRNDVLLTRPFLDISALVSPPPLGERGLLSMAFHPDYQQNGRFFVSYTNVDGDTRIVRYLVSATDPDSADPATASVILPLEQPYSNHNGGLILFGPDGTLFVGLGDGGDAGDPQNRAQNLDSLLGKMLRLDVDGAAPYAVPPDNPFVGNPSARPEIWAWGLRNPWRFSFDRVTGDLYIADVGQGAREEVNRQPAASGGGENYGWNIMEGFACYGSSDCSSAGLTLPLIDYPHSEGCSVTGGYVYRGSALPILYGRYLYSDYCGGWVKSFTYFDGRAVDPIDWSSEIAPGGSGVTSFGEDNQGELYILRAAGTLHRIVPQVTKASRH